MNGSRKIVLLFFLTVLLLVLSFFAEKLYFSDYEYHLRTKFFNRTLAEKQAVMEICLENMKPVLAMEDHHGSVTENDIFQLAEENNITILEYIDRKLIYWSSNEFDVPNFLSDTLFSKPLIFMQNGWFLTKTVMAGNEMLIGLLRIRSDYGFTNDIIRNGFEEDFRLSENIGFSTERNASEYHVNSSDGNFLFSLIFPAKKEISYLTYIPSSLWCLAFFVLILLLMQLLEYFSGRVNRAVTTLLFIVFLFAFYYIFLLADKPRIFFLSELFSPYKFSLNDFIPSLGHLFILSLFSALSAYIFYRDFPYPSTSGGNRFYSTISAVLHLAAGAFFTGVFHFLFSRLVATSNISFESYKVLELSWFSIAGFMSAMMFLLVPVFILYRFTKAESSFSSVIFIIILIVTLPVLAFLFPAGGDSRLPFVLFWFLLAPGIWLTGRKRKNLFNMLLLVSVLTTLYSLYYITVLSEEKTTENLKIQAVTFSTENDPEAEHLLLDLWPEISSDTLLKRFMLSESFNKDRLDVDKLYNYLNEVYFGGYWGNYDFSMVLCSDEDNLQIGSEPVRYENCFDFFDTRIKLNGHQLTGTDFYFIDNQGGRANYTGRLNYRTGKGTINGLFIELYSDVNVFQPGYSELLLDKKYHKYEGVRNYSFAKYINGELVIHNGEFAYDKTDVEYVDKLSDYRIFSYDRYRHVLYKNGSATVMISRPLITAGNLLISFAYLFAFILIFSNLVLLTIRKPSFRQLISLTFRQKLQVSYVGILLVSFTLIGVVVSLLTIYEYRQRHSDNMKEKLNSVYLELESRLGQEVRLSSDWRNQSFANLNSLLVRLSNIFNTDINLYDLNGYIMATSRQEIFFNDLLSRRINNMALINMKDFIRSEFYQNEKIGKLEYISAYVPFYNEEGRLMAYLNLPYFRMQSVLTNEISNLIVAVINFTLLLVVITMGLSVFISGRLTAPLSMLSEGLASVELGKKTEHLSYSGNDEIGDLVRQYNRMLDELDESVKKLANSEREYAWREMAKQIAHEIKNPLTPMKLNVQQLLRSWNDKSPGFDKKIEIFANNQVEYIDNLSTIATAFSSFAKMPGNNPTELDLIEQIRTSLELFRNTENIRFDVIWPVENRVVVFADREHLNGIFSNLIKNAMQSIPPGAEGIIGVRIDVRGNKVLVTISDNGTGIPEEIRKKMFTPNFTTKSSGMGLGLSIVKRYVENAGGNIWFESETGKGTRFFVELPVKFTVEKPL